MNASPSLSACFLCIALPLHATPAHDGAKPSLPDSPFPPITVPLDPAARASLARDSVTASAHGQSLRCEGVSLSALLRVTKAMPVEPLRRPQLASYVVVTARDGYRAVFSLAELDPSIGNRKVILVDRCDGKPLDDKNGPLRLIAPDEMRPARWVRQIESIRVVFAP